ncbi:deoxynucleoside triphosphate triphosphohydrolase SAMHD1-like [Haliotis cracherodii]|uniref:deoxynucleoside triphosphate triphosphohydrolase SAMHD1-like n=1 Tax=Haliotis cracherodii TaxID=6455 RepID=UPI0039E9107F
MNRLPDAGSTPPAKKHRKTLGEGELTFSQDSMCQEDAHSWQFWSVEELAEQLALRGLQELAEKFQGEEIAGKHLHFVTDDKLKQMGIRKMGKILDFEKFLDDVGCKANKGSTYHPNTKIFNDPIHGHVELHPLCVKIIDTPQFQRLRFIKQLGACYFVFPGAAHNRFEHSIGVCHLAGQLTRTLQRRQPELMINDEDILCVEIAGLCHDLGHGPFSHLFDGEFIPLTSGAKWKHEDASVKMFDHLVHENNLGAVFSKFGLTDTDRIFIKEQIKGPPRERLTQTDYPYQGRSKEKEFLYEIVANKRNGIDVDKWDYFARDCYMLGIKNNFDHNRFMKFSRVICVEGVMQICARDKEASSLYDMFHTRSSLHRRAYQHRGNKIVEAMLLEAMIKADDHIKIPGANGSMVKMSKCIEDMVAYTRLTDHILNQIMLSTEPELEESRNIVNNIMCRKLYKCVGQSQPRPGRIISEEDIPLIKSQLIESMTEDDKESEVALEFEDIVVHLVYLDYGMKDKNPIENVRFYNKYDPNTAVEVRKTQVSHMLPEKFAEQMILVYCKDPQQKAKLGIAARCFENWCSKHNMETPKHFGWELTPVVKRGASQEAVSTPPDSRHPDGGRQETPHSAGKFKQKLSF